MFSISNLLKNRFKFSSKLLDDKSEINIRFALVEVVIFVGLVYIIGFFLDKEDPFLINSNFSIALHMLPLAVLTLFYGFLAGSLYMIIFTLAKYFTYGNLDTLYLMYFFLYLLVLSEFNFYWNRLIKRSIEHVEYVEDRLMDVARALYLTKLSHDRLESYQIAKPVSIRGFIEDVRRDILKGNSLEDVLKRVIQLVSNIYTIERGGLFRLNGNRFEIIVKLGDFEEIDYNDTLILKALETGETTYVSDILPEANSRYLCVIPLVIKHGYFYLFVIERMSFFNLNIDSILSINVILDYVLFSYHELVIIRDLYSRFVWMDVDMLKELAKCNYLKQKYNIVSSVVIFKFKSWDESIYHLMLNSVRGLDLVCNCENTAIIALLPFTDSTGAYSFLKRFENILVNFKAEGYEKLGIYHRIYEIKEVETLLTEIEGFIFSSANEVDRAMA